MIIYFTQRSTVYRFIAAGVCSAMIMLSVAKPTLVAGDLYFLEGEWIFLEDKTEGRALEQLTPPMGSKFVFRVADGAVFLVSGHGGARKEVKVEINGTPTEIPGSAEGEIARYSGTWKENAFGYRVEYLTKEGARRTLIQRDFRMTTDGLIVRSNLGAPNGEEYASIGLYRHPADIPMPTPAKSTISDLTWLVGPWVGTRGAEGTTTIEERWSPPLGGSMLATSRTVSRGKLSAFEYLRIVERDGGLVYIAQPNGGVATDFVMTELSNNRAVFENPRHDYPKRIVYERTSDDALVATIGFLKGGTPRRFEYKKQS